MRQKRHIRTIPQPVRPSLGLFVLIISLFLAHSLTSRTNSKTSQLCEYLLRRRLLLTAVQLRTVRSTFPMPLTLNNYPVFIRQRVIFMKGTGTFSWCITHAFSIQQGLTSSKQERFRAHRSSVSVFLDGALPLKLVFGITVKSMSRSLDRAKWLTSDPNCSTLLTLGQGAMICLTYSIILRVPFLRFACLGCKNTACWDEISLRSQLIIGFDTVLASNLRVLSIVGAQYSNYGCQFYYGCQQRMEEMLSRLNTSTSLVSSMSSYSSYSQTGSSGTTSTLASCLGGYSLTSYLTSSTSIYGGFSMFLAQQATLSSMFC